MRTVKFSSVLFFLLPITLYAQRYKPNTTSWKWAATAELGGVSPGFSVNLEYIPIQLKKSFFAVRGGLGYMGAYYSLATVPQSLTWNILLNGKVKGCPPQVPIKSTFVELGLGGAYLVQSTSDIKYVFGPILGVRRYFLFNVRTTGFWKVQLSPMMADHIIPWGGVGIGIVLD